MNCLTPPLAAKPAKGYSWGCLPCTIQRRKDVESEKYRFVTNGGSAPPRAKGGKKEKAVISDKPEVMFRGWPWRYFGLYTNAEDTLNPEDLIFPRAVTRLGVKFQANVMTEEEQEAAEVKRKQSLEATGMPAKEIYERGFDPEETPYETTITMICEPSDERRYTSTDPADSSHKLHGGRDAIEDANPTLRRPPHEHGCRVIHRHGQRKGPQVHGLAQARRL